MKFSVDKQEQYIIYELMEEKLTSANAPLLKSELVMAGTEGYKNIVLDLSDVSFVDSSGLSAILIGNRICSEADGVFAICGLSDAVKSLITISQLDDVLNIFSTQHDALNAINEQ